MTLRSYKDLSVYQTIAVCPRERKSVLHPRREALCCTFPASAAKSAHRCDLRMFTPEPSQENFRPTPARLPVGRPVLTDIQAKTFLAVSLLHKNSAQTTHTFSSLQLFVSPSAVACFLCLSLLLGLPSVLTCIVFIKVKHCVCDLYVYGWMVRRVNERIIEWVDGQTDGGRKGYMCAAEHMTV